MPIQNHLLLLVAISLINIFNKSHVYAMQQSAQPRDKAVNGLNPIIRHVERLFEDTQLIIQGLNESMALANCANKAAINAAQGSTQALEIANHASTTAREAISGIERVQALQTNLIEQAQAAATNIEKQSQAAAANLGREQERLSAALAQDAASVKKIIENVFEGAGEFSLESKIQVEEAREKIKQELGIYEQAEKIRAQANIDAQVGAEKEKWKNIQKILENSKPIIKIAIAIIITTLCLYGIKYGIPMLANYLTRPRVISETSNAGWFGWLKPKPDINIDDLIFTPSLQKQLSDLLFRVQSAKEYNEVFPNVLFYGAPGTGKTAFVKALAYMSGLDYALTSGSEFAKITDLNNANNELRKLLNWSKKSSKGLIVFIDEAESLFANRKLLTTSKATQDFINTFLSLISDQSQKKVMFIFATNHPFKLDDAITNRIGINIEFTLPQASEREKILYMYLVKSDQTNEDEIVSLHPKFMQLIPMYANELEGFSPRAIKFVANEMIISARQQESKELTNEIAQAVIDAAKYSLKEAIVWEKERNDWIGGLHSLQIQN